MHSDLNTWCKIFIQVTCTMVIEMQAKSVYMIWTNIRMLNEFLVLKWLQLDSNPEPLSS